jgi:hypothetical protein
MLYLFYTLILNMMTFNEAILYYTLKFNPSDICDDNLKLEL